MRIEELAQELHRSYFGASDGEKVVEIHLFGIRFAEQIAGMSCKDIAIAAAINESYATEIQKGVKLAKYVTVKPQI